MENKQSFLETSLSHKIAEEITHRIISGQLKPGEKISEYEYAEQFGTSRAPVRESLYLLTTEGLIERIPRKGAIVRGYSKDEIYDICEIRMNLEELAMKRIKMYGINKEILKRMERLINKMTNVIDDQTKYTLLNQELHRLIIKMSGSEVIYDMYWKLGRPLLAVQRMLFSDKKHIEKSMEEHQFIFQLLKEGSIDQANIVLEKHNQSVIKRMYFTNER